MKQFTKKLLEELIIEANDEIRNFGILFNRNSDIFIENSVFSLTVANERTLSINLGAFIEKKLKEIDSEAYIVNELQIKNELEIDQKVLAINDLKIDLTNRKNKIKWKNMFIDFFINFSDHFAIQNPLVFVECKRAKNLTFLHFGGDYLKYKFYSSSLKRLSAFIFVNFTLDNQIPSIISNESKLFAMIGNNINRDDFLKLNTSIYVYKSSAIGNELSFDDSDKIRRIINLIDEVGSNSVDVDEKEYDFSENNDLIQFDNNFYLKNKKLFKRGVATSILLRDNFFEIYKLCTFAEYNADIFEKILSEILVNEGGELNDSLSTDEIVGFKFDKEKLANSTKVKFFEFEKLYKKDKSNAQKGGLYANLMSSYIWLTAMKVFANKYGISLKFNLSNIKQQPRDEKINYSKEMDNKITLLTQKPEMLNDRDIAILAIGSAFFLTKLYEVIFDIDYENKKMSEKKEYRKFYQREKVQKNLNQLSNILDISSIKLYNSNSAAIKDYFAKLVESILKKW